MSPAKSRPPANIRALETWIYAWVEEMGESHGVIRRRIGMLVLAGMLEQASLNLGDQPVVVFKGGSSLELRFASAARTSRDVDLVFTGDLSSLMEVLRQAVQSGWRGFNGRILDPQDLSIPWADIGGQRIEAKLSFNGKPFSTLTLEIVATSVTPDIEYVPAMSLANIGIDPPGHIPCLSLAQQVAEKIHACTDPLDGVLVNDRVNDVMDLIIVEDLAGDDLDPGTTGSRRETVFAERDSQPGPRRSTFNPVGVINGSEWPRTMPSMSPTSPRPWKEPIN